MGQKRLPSFPFNETQKESDPIHKEASGKCEVKLNWLRIVLNVKTIRLIKTVSLQFSRMLLEGVQVCGADVK